MEMVHCMNKLMIKSLFAIKTSISLDIHPLSLIRVCTSTDRDFNIIPEYTYMNMEFIVCSYQLMLEAIDSIVGQSALLRQVMGLPEKEDDFYDELSKYPLIVGKSLYISNPKYTPNI